MEIFQLNDICRHHARELKRRWYLWGKFLIDFSQKIASLEFLLSLAPPPTFDQILPLLEPSVNVNIGIIINLGRRWEDSFIRKLNLFYGLLPFFFRVKDAAVEFEWQWTLMHIKAILRNFFNSFEASSPSLSSVQLVNLQFNLKTFKQRFSLCTSRWVLAKIQSWKISSFPPRFGFDFRAQSD